MVNFLRPLARFLRAAWRFRRECRRAGLPPLTMKILRAEQAAIRRARLVDPTDEAAARLAGDTAAARMFGDALVAAGLAKKRVLESEVLTTRQPEGADRPSVAKRWGQGLAGDAGGVVPGGGQVKHPFALAARGEGHKCQ